MRAELAVLAAIGVLLCVTVAGFGRTTPPAATVSSPPAAVVTGPAPVSIWRDAQVVLVTYRTPANMPRCYLMNVAGGQPIQIECPK